MIVESSITEAGNKSSLPFTIDGPARIDLGVNCLSKPFPVPEAHRVYALKFPNLEPDSGGDYAEAVDYKSLDVIVTTPKRRDTAPRDIKHLEGKYGKVRGLHCHYRFRLLHDHRIIYKIDDDNLEIDIVYLGPHP